MKEIEVTIRLITGEQINRIEFEEKIKSNSKSKCIFVNDVKQKI